jgi:hypothetical protein
VLLPIHPFGFCSADKYIPDQLPIGSGFFFSVQDSSSDIKCSTSAGFETIRPVISVCGLMDKNGVEKL